MRCPLPGTTVSQITGNARKRNTGQSVGGYCNIIAETGRANNCQLKSEENMFIVCKRRIHIPNIGVILITPIRFDEISS